MNWHISHFLGNRKFFEDINEKLEKKRLLLVQHTSHCVCTAVLPDDEHKAWGVILMGVEYLKTYSKASQVSREYNARIWIRRVVQTSCIIGSSSSVTIVPIFSASIYMYDVTSSHENSLPRRATIRSIHFHSSSMTEFPFASTTTHPHLSTISTPTLSDHFHVTRN